MNQGNLYSASYTYPFPGALVKTAFLCTKTIQFSSSHTLAEQLRRKHKGGFEILSWSYLPQGSGMGTSSILAGVVCAAIWTITSRAHDNQQLIHLVVELEQMLTTGGGWQDQVGGLLPGVKFTTSPPKQPIQVSPQILNVSNKTVEKVRTNMALIYTGKTRLAKNLLEVPLALLGKPVGTKLLPTVDLDQGNTQAPHSIFSIVFIVFIFVRMLSNVGGRELLISWRMSTTLQPMLSRKLMPG